MLVASVVIAVGALVRRGRAWRRARDSRRNGPAAGSATSRAMWRQRGVPALMGLTTAGAGVALSAVVFC